VIHFWFSADGKQLFACSGTIVEFSNGFGYVVTSASLVRCPDKDELADELKVAIFSFLYGTTVFLINCKH
jgi:hypothetical protein